MPALPATIAGVQFRYFRDESDFERLLTIYNSARLADGISGIETLEGITNSYRHLTNCDLDRDLIIAETAAGDAVAYGRVTWWIEEANQVRRLLAILFVHPDWRGRGLGAQMQRWLEGRLAEVAAEHPHSGEQYLTAFVDQGETEREALLAASGYERIETYAEMTRLLSDPIPALALPAGVVVRPTTWDDARAVWEADDRAFRDHVGYSPQTETDYERWRSWEYNDPSLWMVAFAGDAVAGQVLNHINAAENATLNRRWGYTESISVQREWRRRGIARALIADSMRRFRDMGMEYAALGVHTTNPNGAFPLYEGLGYRVTQLSWQLRKPLAP